MCVRDVFSSYLAAIFPPCDFAFSGLLQRFRFRSACMRFSFGLLQSFSLCVRAIFIFISDYCCKVYRRVCMLFSDCLMQSFFLCTCVLFFLSGCCKVYRCAGVLLNGLLHSVFLNYYKVPWCVRVLSRTTAKLFRCVCVMFSRATAKFIGVCIFFFSGCWMPRLSLCVCACYLSGCCKAYRCVGVLLTGLLHSVSSGLSQSSLSHVRAPPGLLVTKLLDGYV